MPGIRLSRSSSARNVLAKKEEDGTGTVEEEYDHKAKEGVGLPNRKALDLLRRLNEAVNEPFHPVGISFYDKVQSVKVSNVEKVLSSITWREFFNGKSLMEANKSKKILHEQAKQERQQQQTPNRKTALPKFATVPPNFREIEIKNSVRKPPYPLSIEQSFENMLSRVNILWKELRVPDYERNFYSESLLTKPYSIMKCKALATYVVALQNHRDCTSEVLQLIQKREVALKEVQEALLNIFKPRPTSLLDENGGHVTKIRSLKKESSETIYEPFSPNRMHLQQAIFKEELLIVLKKLQMCTLHVIRAIQLWRENLWRPLPFLWIKQSNGRSMAVDYLLKIKDDLLIIDTNEVAAEFINSIPLAREDLHLILFDLPRNKFAESNFEDSYGTYESTKDSEYFQPEMSRKFPENNIHPRNVKQINDFAEEDISKDPLRGWFIDHEDSVLEEFKVALDVVVLQPYLLSTLYKENDIMRRNGSFIPNLKVTFDNIQVPEIHFREEEKEREEKSKSLARIESDITVERHKKTTSFKRQQASSPLQQSSILSAADDSLDKSFDISPRKNKTVVIIHEDKHRKHVHHHHSEAERKSNESEGTEDHDHRIVHHYNDHDHRIVHHYDDKETFESKERHEHRTVHKHHHEESKEKHEHRVVHKHDQKDSQKEIEIKENSDIDPKLLDALKVIEEAQQEKQEIGQEVDEEDEYSMEDAFHAESEKVTTSNKLVDSQNQSEKVSISSKSDQSDQKEEVEEWMLLDGHAGEPDKIVSQKSDHYEDDFES